MAKLFLSSTILLLALALRSAPALAEEHLIGLQLGVPIPLVVHGSRTSGGSAPKLLFSGQAEYLHRLPRTHRFLVGGWVGISHIRSDNTHSSHVEFASLGTELAWRPSPWASRQLQLTATAGIGALLTKITVDENINKSTISLGGRVSLRLSKHITKNWSAGLGLGFEAYGAPLYDPIWFNRRLGGTRFLVIGLSLEWRPRGRGAP